MTEIEEALEVFEEDMSLGLSSTKIMGRVLAKAYREQEAKIKVLENQVSRKEQWLMDTKNNFHDWKDRAEKLWDFAKHMEVHFNSGRIECRNCIDKFKALEKETDHWRNFADKDGLLKAKTEGYTEGLEVGSRKEIELKSRIAAMEKALKESLDRIKESGNSDRAIHKPHFILNDVELWLSEALSSSKLGDLFSALLEEHKERMDGNIQGTTQAWLKSESLLKECGL